MIRQYTWLHLYNESEPYFPLDFLHPVGGRVHVDHYFEALRLSLMCYSDITPVLIEYDTNRRIGRVADFSVHHKCRNFDRIVDWLQENGVGIPFVNVTREGGLQ